MTKVMPKNKNKRTHAYVKHTHKIYGMPQNFFSRVTWSEFQMHRPLLVIICLSAKSDSVQLCHNIQSRHVIALLAFFIF